MLIGAIETETAELYRKEFSVRPKLPFNFFMVRI
jgi:hypothetical protein